MHATKMINYNSKAETIDGPFTNVAKPFFTYKKLNFVNEEVRAGCPKLGHTALTNIAISFQMQTKKYF